MTTPPESEPTIYDKAYWKDPDPKPKGDEDGKTIRYAVGCALSNWEYMEEDLTNLFMFLTECTPHGRTHLAVRRAFGAIHSSGLRRDMIGAAAEVYFAEHWKNKEVTQPLIRLLDVISMASRKRDNIAHGTVIDSISVNSAGNSRIIARTPNPDAGIRMGFFPDQALGAFLVPSRYHTKSNTLAREQSDDDPLGWMPGRYRYTSEDILMFSMKFHDLGREVGLYQHWISKEAGNYPYTLGGNYPYRGPPALQS